MNKIGIFLAFSPDAELENQGISRLLSFLLQGANSPGNTASNSVNTDKANAAPASETRFVLASPYWGREAIFKLLDDNDIERDSLDYIFTDDLPLALQVHRTLKRHRSGNAPLPLRAVMRNAIGGVGRFVTTSALYVLTLPTFKAVWLVLLASVLMLGAIGLAALALYRNELLLPLLGVLGLGVALITLLLLLERGSRRIPLLRRVFGLGRRVVFGVARRGFGIVRRMAGRGLRLFRVDISPYDLYRQIYAAELQRLIDKINTRDDIGVWYAPALFWPEMKAINAPCVIMAPDVLFLEFPTYFNQKIYVQTEESIRETLRAGTHFICASDHVKRRHLVEGYGVDPERISVIRHGRIDLSDHLQGAMFDRRNKALSILSHYQKRLAHNHYLHGFDFSRTRFLFVSSQIRPYKNMVHLLDAYRQLLRRSRIDIKMIVTGNFEQYPDARDHLIAHRLQYDVLQLYNVPSEVLAALNCLAELSIQPSLFEGGFPFTFTEAYSVGTPSLLADIPVTRERLDDPAFAGSELAQRMLFDPYRVQDMAEKIQWGLEHRDALIQMQKPLYDSFDDWERVAARYLAVIQSSAANERAILRKGAA